MKNVIIANNGSIQSIPSIPDDIKAIYKTVWEISQKKVLDLAADRGAFICQSQSLNVHLQSPTIGQLTSMHFYGWKKGLKTGMYYLRTRPAAQAIQFTIDPTLKAAQKVQQPAPQSSPPGLANSRPDLLFSQLPGSPSKVPSLGSSSSVSTSSSSLQTAPSVSSTNGLTSSTSLSQVSSPPSIVSSQSVDIDLSLDERTRKAAEEDPEFAAALKRQKERELEEAKLMCSLENKEACLMCSG